MRKIAILAVLAALVAGAAFAQPDMGNTAISGATYTTGIVQAFDGSAVTIKESSNRVVTLLIDKATVGADHPLIGSRVRVNFHHNEKGQAVADEIQGLPGEEPKPPTIVVNTPVLPTEPAPQPTYTKPVYTPAPTPAPTAEPAPTLPKGGSPLATVGLVGLLALGGALALRFRS